jgi:hypothetical protein
VEADWYGWDDLSLIEPHEEDFEGVAAHEAGHTTGFWGMYADCHFDPNGDYCPFTSARHTMCPSQEDGSASFRSLEEHDIHTFQNAYPNA